MLIVKIKNKNIAHFYSTNRRAGSITNDSVVPT